MSAKIVQAKLPKPKGSLVVVGTEPAETRSNKSVLARVVVRDDTGQEFYFDARAIPAQLSPFYR